MDFRFETPTIWNLLRKIAFYGYDDEDDDDDIVKPFSKKN